MSGNKICFHTPCQKYKQFERQPSCIYTHIHLHTHTHKARDSPKLEKMALNIVWEHFRPTNGAYETTQCPHINHSIGLSSLIKQIRCSPVPNQRSSPFCQPAIVRLLHVPADRASVAPPLPVAAPSPGREGTGPPSPFPSRAPGPAVTAAHRSPHLTAGPTPV